MSRVYSGDWIVTSLLVDRAERFADEVAIATLDGQVTYAQLVERAAQVAAMLSSLGVEPGDRVATMLTTSLDYVAAWQTAAEDPEFRSSQDEIVDRDSYIPAMQTADELGLETALARAQQLYDTALQLGNGEDADGLDVSDLTPQLTPARGSDEDRSMTEARTAAKPAATRSTQKIEW